MKKTIYVLLAVGVIALLYLKPWATTTPDSTEVTGTSDTTEIKNDAPADIVDTNVAVAVDTNAVKEEAEVITE